MSLRLLVLLLSLFLSSCFGTDKSGGIVKYSGGEIYTGRGHFTVGNLPAGWSGPKIRLKQLIYENNPMDATIVTDALCGSKFDDAPLPLLARNLLDRMENKKIEREGSLTLDGRAAYRLRGGGAVDGVSMKMEVVILKRNFCLYDFVYFAPPKTFAKGIGDFEAYFYGFKSERRKVPFRRER